MRVTDGETDRGDRHTDREYMDTRTGTGASRSTREREKD
jgi:hypothetical protein